MSEPDEDFAAMFEASVKAKRFETGQTLEGTIVAIGPEVAFVNVGGKGEATIEIAELKDADGDLEVAVGDRIQAMVVSTAGGLTLSRKLVRGAATARQLEDAFRAGLPVEGKVERAVKGGYEVRIAGQRAFCPFSQIDTVRNGPVRARRQGLRIPDHRVQGRRQEPRRLAACAARGGAAGAAAEIRRSNRRRRGDDRPRRVGARVRRLRRPRAAACRACCTCPRWGGPACRTRRRSLKPGEEITVKVLRVDEDRQKIALGLKQLTADPWSSVHATYEMGQVRTGRVTRVAEFGAFVELEPGVEGLAHASTFAPTGRAEGWSTLVAPGMTAAFEILSIDLEKKRIGVALVPEGSARAGGTAPPKSEIVPGARLTGKVERHEKFGVFVFLAPGRTGLIPMSETGVAREADVARAFPVGADVDVVVLEVDPAGRRIRLSAKAVLDAREADEVREYAEREDAAPPEGFGSLADKLRGALEPREK